LKNASIQQEFTLALDALVAQIKDDRSILAAILCGSHLGPEGGHAGGEVVVTGTPEDIAASKNSHTGRFLKGHLRQE
jgi:hypothetical protein